MPGKFATVNTGAVPGVPPRGTVRVTCDGGSGVLHAEECVEMLPVRHFVEGSPSRQSFE